MEPSVPRSCLGLTKLNPRTTEASVPHSCLCLTKPKPWIDGAVRTSFVPRLTKSNPRTTAVSVPHSYLGVTKLNSRSTKPYRASFVPRFDKTEPKNNETRHVARMGHFRINHLTKHVPNDLSSNRRIVTRRHVALELGLFFWWLQKGLRLDTSFWGLVHIRILGHTCCQLDFHFSKTLC